MIDSSFTLLSALIGLLLLNGAVLVNGRASQKGWLGELPVEVRYVVWLSFVLLIGLNGNQWVAGNHLFPLLAVTSIFTIVVSVRKLTDSCRRGALRDVFSLFVVQIFVILAVFVAFEMSSYWLLEAPNHDSLVYYQGLYWANESPLFVGKEAVRARFGGLGVCGEGASWIGYDCPLYRGGTYTLVAWVQYFAPRIIGNGLYFIAAYAATLAWFAVRLLQPSAKGFREILATGLLAIAVSLSTGLMGALVNSNLATVMGGASLAVVASLAFRSELKPKVRFGLMAAWCAVCAHFYAESVFYAGLLISLVFLLELRKLLKALKVFGVTCLAIFLFLIVFGLGNIAVGQAFSSLFVFGEVAIGGEWFSWYLHQSPMFWIGGFIGGLLMGSGVSIPMVVLAAVITLLAAAFLLYLRQTRSGTIALIITSFLAVFYVEVTGYQYGEHKILHLLGPAWALLLVAAILRLVHRGSSNKSLSYTFKIAGGGLFFSFFLILSGFFLSAFSLLNNWRGPHGLDFGLTTLASYIRPGDTVLLEDSTWLGVEKFHKAHYLTFQLHNQGAEVLMPNITSDSLRGGYFRNTRHDTLSVAEDVDWLLQSRGHLITNSKFVSTYGAPVWENADYRLYDAGKNPLLVAGNGWHDCEPTHCWTTAPFEIETYVTNSGFFELSIDFWTFKPPENGTITVSTSDGEVLTTSSVSSGQLRVALPSGWSRLVFDGSWTVSSPQDAGISGDSRKLFAAIERVEVIPLQMNEVE